MSNNESANRLIDESSPYLLQHAHNPVDWFPWGEEAFRRAREENKPIFLSIGYSACHWCHVMERESFEDRQIADFLNEYFVSVKVDREERPDVDQIYMDAVIAMTGSGGWPLTAFLTPELKPFYGGTYFPPREKWGRPGFLELIQSIQMNWTERPQQLVEGGHKVAEFLENMPFGKADSGESTLSSETLDRPIEYFKDQYDEINGGFGNAPKFPPDSGIDFLLRRFRRTGDEDALKMAIHTLKKMSRGGMFDHLGGGFHRYSTDEKWLVPHFEKMLYNQATLAPLFVDAWLLTRDDELRETAARTLDYVLREMHDEKGGFYSATDADSEGVEGKFFVWTREELENLLGKADAALFADYYDVNEQNSFEGMGSILHVDIPVGEFAASTGEPAEELESRLSAAREKLLEARAERAQPGLDDKVLTGWNAMMISALCRGYQVFEDQRYLDAAERAGHFILDTMWAEDGRLLRAWRDGPARIPGTLEDYSWTVAALMDLYESDFEPAWLEASEMIARKMLELFHDQENGGFFFSDGTDGSLIVRKRQVHDNAYPSPTAVAVRALCRLSAFTGREGYLKLAEDTLHANSDALNNYGHAMPTLVSALETVIRGLPEVAIVSPAGDPAGNEMLRVVRQTYRPDRVVMFAETPVPESLQDEWPLLSGKQLIEGEAAAYVCENYICTKPTAEPSFLARQLAEM